MAKEELSVGYNTLVKGLIYDFKPDANVPTDWTPHNIRRLIIMKSGVHVTGYCPSIKVTKQLNGFIAIKDDKISDSEKFRNILDAMHKFTGSGITSLSARVSNCEDIIVVAGGRCGIDVPVEEIPTLIGYATLQSVTSSKFTLPNLIIVDGVRLDERANTLKSNNGQTFSSEKTLQLLLDKGAVNLSKALIKQCQEAGAPDKLTLRHSSKDDIAWSVYNENTDLSLNCIKSDFIMDSKGTKFATIFSAFELAENNKLPILKKFRGNVSYASFDFNVGNYPIDQTLREYMADNQYKALCARDYYLAIVNKADALLELKGKLKSANDLLSVMVEAKKSPWGSAKAWRDYITADTLSKFIEAQGGNARIKAIMGACSKDCGIDLSSFGSAKDITSAEFNTVPAIINKAVQALALFIIFKNTSRFRTGDGNINKALYETHVQNVEKVYNKLALPENLDNKTIAVCNSLDNQFDRFYRGLLLNKIKERLEFGSSELSECFAKYIKKILKEGY